MLYNLYILLNKTLVYYKIRSSLFFSTSFLLGNASPMLYSLGLYILRIFFLFNFSYIRTRRNGDILHSSYILYAPYILSLCICITGS